MAWELAQENPEAEVKPRDPTHRCSLRVIQSAYGVELESVEAEDDKIRSIRLCSMPNIRCSPRQSFPSSIDHECRLVVKTFGVYLHIPFNHRKRLEFSATRARKIIEEAKQTRQAKRKSTQQDSNGSATKRSKRVIPRKEKTAKLASAQSLEQLLENYGSLKKDYLPGAESVMTMLRVCVQFGPPAVSRLWEEVKQEVPLTSTLTTMFIHRLRQGNNLDAAFEVFSRYLTQIQTPEQSVIGTMLKACTECHQVNACLRVLRELSDREHKLDQKLFSGLVSKIKAVGDRQTAEQVVELALHHRWEVRVDAECLEWLGKKNQLGTHDTVAGPISNGKRKEPMDDTTR